MSKNTTKTTAKNTAAKAPKTSMLKRHIYRFTPASTVIHKQRKVVELHDRITVTQTVTFKKERVGVIVATKRNDGTIGVGYSLCHRHAPEVVGCLHGSPIFTIGDKYDEETAIRIASGRALNPAKLEIPATVQAEFNQMTIRAKKFFKAAA